MYDNIKLTKFINNVSVMIQRDDIMNEKNKIDILIKHVQNSQISKSKMRYDLQRTSIQNPYASM